MMTTHISSLNFTTPDYISDIFQDNSSNFSTAIESFNNSNSSAPMSRGVSRFYPLIITEMVLSIVCLAIIIFVYSVLPGRRNVHSKNLISLSSCLMMTFIFLILDLLFRNRLSPDACYAFAMIIHFSFLATFFWTNTMSFDICRKMTNLKPRSTTSTSNKYKKYSVYVWIATTIAALPAAIFDRVDWLPEAYRPNIGVRRCWLSGTRSFVIYFNAPVGVLLFSNLIMFFITIWSLIKIKKTTDKMHIKQQQQRFKIYVKLLLVVGVIWLTEFLPWATGIYKLYALAGILTSLHGVLLFLIFVCKRRIFRQICEKFDLPWAKGAEGKKIDLSHSTMSSSSNHYRSDIT